MEHLYEPAAFLVLFAALILLSGAAAFIVVTASLVVRSIWGAVTKPKQSRY